jgi:hypothetical protein
MKLKITKLLTLFLTVIVYGANLNAATYYSKGSLDATQTASWNSNQDGTSGSAPSNFTTAGDIFVVQNTHAMTTSAAMTIGAAGGNTGKLQIATGGKLTATFDITIKIGVSFQIDAGGTYEHNVASNMSLLFGGTESFDTNSNFVILQCAATPNVPDGGYGNLTMKNAISANLGMNGRIQSVKGNLSFEITATGTAKFALVGTQTSTLNVGGNLTVNSPDGTGVVQMVNSTGSSTINVTGNVNIQKGTFSLYSGASSAPLGVAALTIAGSLSISSTGTISSPVAASPTTISFSGSNSVFSNSGTFGNAANINFNVNSGSTLTINSDLGFGGTGRTFVVDGSATTNNGTTFTNNGTITVNAGKSFAVNGTLTNNSSIQLLSNSTGTGTLITNGTVNGTGTYSINQYLTTGRNWYISNPMNTAVSPTVASGTVTINGYDETTVTNGAGTWAVTTNPLAVGKGYVASVSTDGNITFTGTPNTGNKNISLTSRTGTADKAGFNLIGNPYPSYLDWSLVVANTENAAKLRSNTLWYRTKKLNQESQLVYQFQTVNGDGISVPNDGNAIIPPMQSFWVRAVAGVSNPIVVTNAMRAHAPVSDKLLKVPAAKNTDRTLVRLQVSNGVNTDETVLYVSENALNELDNYDAPKMSNGNTNIPEIFTTLNSEQLAINALNNIPKDTPIGLGFIPGNATSFSIKANEISNLPSDLKVILKDNVTLSETDLTDGTSAYTFSPEVTNNDRFSLIFRTSGVTTGTNNRAKLNAQIFVNAANQITIIAPEKSIYAIYNAIGQKVKEGITSANRTIVNSINESGVYVVQVCENSRSNSIRIILNGK